MTTIARRKSMASNGAPGPAQSPGKICLSSQAGDLARINRPDVLAVVYDPPSRPPWMRQLARAVEGGGFSVPRTLLSRVTEAEIRRWLETNLPWEALPGEAAAGLFDALMEMVAWERRLTGAEYFMLRLFTEAPTARCGFHLDTAVPRAPTVGLLRVFNGPGTRFVQPENLVGMGAFYRYFGTRERLGKQLEGALEQEDAGAVAALEREIDALDRELPFLHDPAEVHTVPEGALVAFKHLDARLHWSDHAPGLAWIHCSPHAGPPRLVVNLTAWEGTAPGLQG